MLTYTCAIVLLGRVCGLLVEFQVLHVGVIVVANPDVTSALHYYNRRLGLERVRKPNLRFIRACVHKVATSTTQAAVGGLLKRALGLLVRTHNLAKNRLTELAHL